MGKLIYYDAKLPRLIPLLMLAAFPYEAQVVTDLRTTQGEPGAACTLRPTSSLSTMWMCKHRETSCCSAPVRVDGRRKHYEIEMNAAYTIVDCNIKDACTCDRAVWDEREKTLYFGTACLACPEGTRLPYPINKTNQEAAPRQNFRNTECFQLWIIQNLSSRDQR